MSNPNHFPYGKQEQGGKSTEIDYGDIPEHMNEQDMRAYLALESKLVMPDKKRRDSFEQQWNAQRQKYNSTNQPQSQSQSQNYQQAQTSNNPQQFAFQQQNKPKYSNNGFPIKPNYKHTASSTTSKTTVNSSVYSHTDYDPNVVDRMSTVTIVSQKGKHRREHSFKKQPVQQQQPMYIQGGPVNNNNPQQHINNNNNANLPPLSQSQSQNQTAQFPYNSNLPINGTNNNNYNNNNNNNNNNYNQNYNNNNNNNNRQNGGYPPQQMVSPRSALTAQIQPQKQHLANQSSGNQSGVVQSRNANGKLVVKQIPYSKKTHVCINVFVEIKPDHIEQIIVHFSKHFSVKQFLDLLKNETNNAAFTNTELEIFCADDEGDLDDDFPAPEQTAIIANLGLKNFYIKLKGANDDQRNDIRRSTLTYKDQLMSTEEVDKMHSLDEEDSDEESEYEEDEGCSCVIL